MGEQSLVVQKLEREQKLDRGVCSRPNFRAARMGEKKLFVRRETLATQARRNPGLFVDSFWGRL